MEGSESFKRIKPDEEIELKGTAEEQKEKADKAQLVEDAKGVEAEELPADENVVMEGDVEEQRAAKKAQKDLEDALNKVEVDDLGKADVIEMKGPAPNPESEEGKDKDNRDRLVA